MRRSGEQRGQATTAAFLLSARKGSNSKQMYLSLPTAPQGRASCLWVECQYTVGTVAGGQRKFHISPRFLPLCNGPVDPASLSGESPASQPALETQAPGQGRALKPPARQPLPQQAGPWDRAIPTWWLRCFLSQERGPRGKSVCMNPRDICAVVPCVRSQRLLLL